MERIARKVRVLSSNDGVRHGEERASAPVALAL